MGKESTMRDSITTTDLSQFGSRELAEAGRLLTAITEQGLPDDFWDDGITVMFNTSSGYVFLTNSDYQVAMFNEDKPLVAGGVITGFELESFYSCPNCGEEGFADEIDWNGDQGCCGKCAWHEMALQDKIYWCVDHKLSIFAARRDEIPA